MVARLRPSSTAARKALVGQRVGHRVGHHPLFVPTVPADGWSERRLQSPAMELLLVRHGEPEWVRDGFNVDDPPLTTRGHEQAERLAGRLADEHFDEIYVSPMTRARQTAAPCWPGWARTR